MSNTTAMPPLLLPREMLAAFLAVRLCPRHSLASRPHDFFVAMLAVLAAWGHSDVVRFLLAYIDESDKCSENDVPRTLFLLKNAIECITRRGGMRRALSDMLTQPFMHPSWRPSADSDHTPLAVSSLAHEWPECHDDAAVATEKIHVDYAAFVLRAELYAERIGASIECAADSLCKPVDDSRAVHRPVAERLVREVLRDETTTNKRTRRRIHIELGASVADYLTDTVSSVPRLVNSCDEATPRSGTTTKRAKCRCAARAVTRQRILDDAFRCQLALDVRAMRDPLRFDESTGFESTSDNSDDSDDDNVAISHTADAIVQQ